MATITSDNLQMTDAERELYDSSGVASGVDRHGVFYAILCDKCHIMSRSSLPTAHEAQPEVILRTAAKFTDLAEDVGCEHWLDYQAQLQQIAQAHPSSADEPSADEPDGS